ncbi:hypothetical protein [Tenacibaculum finnmarkense]|uniref:hypothetical protein n=1 Tax=Tenacibaculum finnmarkense TaxID=2781243 RepID=UPI00207A8136|nr:hypothetical protein [Tenacibaculum finnmarkense]MCM8906780.1 hypothetical protein [Tenacibaculum finnmarkense genomovar finnmarkense]
MAYTVTDKSTQHGLLTPHGIGVPHKKPLAPGEDDVTALFADLARQLYPTGRAFNVKYNSVFYNLHKSFNVSFLRVLEDAQATIDSTFPDNENFTIEDVELWEYRLGLTSNNAVALNVRRDIILSKIAYPKNIKARQHPSFVESQLRASGFDVYIHENRFFEGGEWIYKLPNEVANISLEESQHGGNSQHGDSFQHGASGFEVIANSSSSDEVYSVGESNLWATFFIGGVNLGDFTTVPENRTKEFRELVLKLKPAHLVAVTFINFV